MVLDIELLADGHKAVVVDNLCNSSSESLARVEQITNKKVKFYNADIRDRDALEKIFEENTFDCCINFAGLKAVGESVIKPWSTMTTISMVHWFWLM